MSSYLELILILLQAVVAPFMLRSQLYSLVDDRTKVDRELDELRCEFALAGFMCHAISCLTFALEALACLP